MNDINYISSIVKILEKPEKIEIIEDFIVLKCRVQLFKHKKNISNENSKTILNLVISSQFSEDFINYYHINDYLLIEGYVYKYNPLKISNKKQWEYNERVKFLIPLLFLKRKSRKPQIFIFIKKLYPYVSYK